jgi:SAM-dependent methyltransferase
LRGDWWRRAFAGGAFPVEELARSPGFAARTRRDVPFLMRALKLRRGDALLDVCCGPGRLSAPLSKKGLRVTGVDIAERYLKTARKNAPACRFLRRDMRDLRFDGEFDAAINMWTSFGYFDKAADDLKAARSMRRALKPGGRLLIELVNGARLRAILAWQRSHEVPPDAWSEAAPGLVILERPRLIRRDSVVENEWLVLNGRKRTRLVSRTRLYDGHSLAALLERAGLRVERFYGGCDGSAYDPSDSLRLVVVAKKPR